MHALGILLVFCASYAFSQVSVDMSEQLVILRSDDASGQRAERARVVSIIRTAAARMRVADRKLPRIILIYGCALPCARVAEMELGGA